MFQREQLEALMRPGYAVPALAVLVVVGCARAPAPSSPAPEVGDRLRYSLGTGGGAVEVARALRVTPETLFVERLVPSMTGGPARWEHVALATESLVRLEKRVGRRGNAMKGALIGAGVGLAGGVFCANEEGGWLQPSPTECILVSTASGALTGAGIGALVRSDVWRPVVLPLQPRRAPGDPGIPAVSLGVGVRFPLSPRVGARR